MLLERAIQATGQETSLNKEQYSAGKIGIVQRVQEVLTTVPELVSVRGHENDFLYLFNASTDLVVPSLDYLIGFSVQITRNKEKDGKVESIRFYNSDMIPQGDATFYRLDVTSGPEVVAQYNKIKDLIDRHPEMAGLKDFLNNYTLELNPGELSFVSDRWAETKVTSEQINQLLDNSTGYQLPAKHSGLNLKTFIENLQSGAESEAVMDLLS